MRTTLLSVAEKRRTSGLPGVILCFGLWFTGMSTVLGQTFTKDSYFIPVSVDGQAIDHPFTGGLYNPMHQFIDIDADGDLDLFIYEYADGNLFFYRNIGSPQAAEFDFEREPFEKPPVYGWFLLADVNGDGGLDFLTSSEEASTLSIYLNDGIPQLPSYSLWTDALLDSAGVPVYAENYSIAGVCDIDADGDPDFFSLNSSSGTINFYENIGDATNFFLAFRTSEWQGIRICVGCGLSMKQNRSFDSHGNGAIHFADVNTDNDFDLFYGDLFDPGLFYFENIGDSTNAIMDSVTADFPPPYPVNTGGYNQPTLVDIDDDGDPDMFVSVLFPLIRVNNFYFYTNIGTPQTFEFQLTSSNYLKTLDFGLQAAPALVDVDADSDMDLFVGDLDGHVTFLRNGGTPSQPAFVLEDSAFISSTTSYTYAPTFADIDADGDMDMFLGHFGGKIEFYRNLGTPSSAQFMRETWTFDTLTVSLYAAPAFFDIDDDSDLDLFIGRGLGTISLYLNDGSPQAWSFAFVTSDFLGSSVGYNAKPHFLDEDGDGDLDLLVGSLLGELRLYRNEGPPGNPVFTLVTNFYANTDSLHDAAPAMADIDSDGDQDLFLGSYRGGVEFYRNGPATSVTDQDPPEIPRSVHLLQNFPNPFNSSTVIQFSIPSHSIVDLRIIDLLGREIAVLVSQSLPAGHHSIRWDASSMSSGTYFYRLRSNGHIITRKLLLLQ